MPKNKTFLLLSASLLALIFSGCTSTETPRPSQPAVPQVQSTPVTETVVAETPVSAVHKEEQIDLNQKGPLFRSGMDDGCATAKGKYRKNSENYNNAPEYKDGWFYGRRKCQAH